MKIWVTASRLFAERPMPQNAACRQRVITTTGAYFARFHREGWEFLGSEVKLGTGRVDLIWRTPNGRIVIDEVKVTASGAVVDDADTIGQVRRYNDAATSTWGDAFVGVRLLPLTAPGWALWCSPTGERHPLATADAEVR